ncbi:hypothetical protein GCM10010080_14810 [Thermomonas carbonis]|nr:hypothetical protein GCM10010080_14810 [Thermomonas carbonis]
MTAGHDIASNTEDQRRRRARRTALVLGAVVVAVYLGFLLSGVVGR